MKKLIDGLIMLLIVVAVMYGAYKLMPPGSMSEDTIFALLLFTLSGSSLSMIIFSDKEAENNEHRND